VRSHGPKWSRWPFHIPPQVLPLKGIRPSVGCRLQISSSCYVTRPCLLCKCSFRTSHVLSSIFYFPLPSSHKILFRCRGLKVLVDLLDEDFAEQSELIVHALNGIGSVFELQSPTSTKNDFCRLFIREGLLDPLSSALLNVMASRGDAAADMKRKIIQILLVFCQVSQSDIHVRNALGTRKVVRRSYLLKKSSFFFLVLG
jgi:hypothetical protein